jgi:membrane protein required for colicin V production
MEGFTLVDAVVAVVIVLSAILAYSRGLTREMLAIAGWVGAAVLAFLFAAQAEPLVKELPVVGEVLAGSCELSRLAAFAVVFALGLILMALFTPLFASMVQRSVLGGVDQALGFLFGVLRGVILVAVAFLVYDRAVASDTVPMVDDSRSKQVFSAFQASLESNIPSDAPGWIVQQYEALVGDCNAPAGGTPAPAAPAPAAPTGG